MYWENQSWDISWQGHGSGSSPSQTSSPDDVRYLPTYIPVPDLLWMDSTGAGTDICLRSMKKVESRWWGDERREDEEKTTRKRKQDKTDDNPSSTIFFFPFLQTICQRRRKTKERAGKGKEEDFIYTLSPPPPKFPQLPGRLPQCPRGLPYVHTYIHIYIHPYIHTYIPSWLAEYVKYIYIYTSRLKYTRRKKNQKKKGSARFSYLTCT